MHQLGTSSPRLYPERVAISFWASQGDLSTSSASPGFPVTSSFLQDHSEHLPLALYCAGSYRHEGELATAPSFKELAVQWGRLTYDPGIELPCAKRWDMCARGRNSMEVRATVSAWEVRHAGEGVFSTLKSRPHPSLKISSILFRVYSGGWKSAGSPPGPSDRGIRAVSSGGKRQLRGFGIKAPIRSSLCGTCHPSCDLCDTKAICEM